MAVHVPGAITESGLCDLTINRESPQSSDIDIIFVSEITRGIKVPLGISEHVKYFIIKAFICLIERELLLLPIIGDPKDGKTLPVVPLDLNEEISSASGR